MPIDGGRLSSWRRAGQRRRLYDAFLITFFLGLSACSQIGAIVPGLDPEPVDQQRIPQRPAEFEAALKENQTALDEGRGSPDVALFKIGVILAHPSNPKKDDSRAMRSFKALVQKHPQSAFSEPAKAWIQVLEERRGLAQEKQKLAEERRALARDRETLSQERQKLDYVNQKSLQLDLEIEKRRRSLRK